MGFKEDLIFICDELDKAGREDLSNLIDMKIMKTAQIQEFDLEIPQDEKDVLEEIYLNLRKSLNKE
mgnify:CR=1 FL=1